MKYTQPTVAVLGEASVLIESLAPNKPTSGTDNANGAPGSGFNTPAYDLDE